MGDLDSTSEMNCIATYWDIGNIQPTGHNPLHRDDIPLLYIL